MLSLSLVYAAIAFPLHRYQCPRTLYARQRADSLRRRIQSFCARSHHARLHSFLEAEGVFRLESLRRTGLPPEILPSPAGHRFSERDSCALQIGERSRSPATEDGDSEGFLHC